MLATIFFSPRTLGKNWKPGHSQAWTFLQIGVGRIYASKYRLRSVISMYSPECLTSPIRPAADANFWASWQRVEYR